ncbi:hypothetical protein I4U23_025825 [Adineta vaga]|nr:hypothetical protein I4U23_025825 [Adineta vaga]
MNTEVVTSRPHPVLDNPIQMMRIIANPVYDRLTVSRAAHINKLNPSNYDCKLIRLNRQKEKSMNTSVKSFNNEQLITMPLSTNVNKIKLKSETEHQNFRRIDENESHSSSTTITNTIRYVNSRHGFEIHRYSSPNSLSIDLLTRDACQAQEQTFREMLDKQEESESISQNIYTLEYYHQRYKDLLESYKRGYLTRQEWAKQNYQLHCLKTYYTQALNREQSRLSLRAQKLRQRRADNVFKQWKEAKDAEKNGFVRERSKTIQSPQITERTSVLSNPSFSLHSNTTNRISTSTSIVNEFDELSIYQPVSSLKNSNHTLYMLDKRRSSLQAMLKRIVGLDEPLPPSPKIQYRQQSSRTNTTDDSGFLSNF